MSVALLVVSFGTTHPEAIEKAIVPTENAIRAVFPRIPFYRAFTSSVVRSRLEQSRGIRAEDVAQALDRIRRDGHSHVLVQPTLIFPGTEYDKLRTAVSNCGQGLCCTLGSPLLSCEEDLDRLVSLLRQVYPAEADTGLLLMGHGTDNGANGLYEGLSRRMESLPMGLCTAGGSPTFAEGAARMKALGVRQVRLAPLLLVAGAHAAKDMAGTSPGSLRCLLEEQGFSVTPMLQGLGELDAVRQMYADNARRAFSHLISTIC